MNSETQSSPLMGEEVRGTSSGEGAKCRKPRKDSPSSQFTSSFFAEFTVLLPLREKGVDADERARGFDAGSGPDPRFESSSGVVVGECYSRDFVKFGRLTYVVEMIKYDSEAQQREITETAKEIRDAIEGWQRIQGNVDKLVSRHSAKRVAVAMLCRRQLAFLGGAALAAEGGRPEVVITALRSLYEGWLTLLAICYLPNPPGKRGHWARRYLAFGKFQVWQTNLSIRDAHLEVSGPPVDIDAWIDRMRKDWQQHAKEFPKITDSTRPWHGFNGTTGLYMKLWPKGHPAVFPRTRMKGGRKNWEQWFEMGFRFPSQFAHGQPGVVGTYASHEDDKGLLSLHPVYQAGFLRACQGFAFASLEMLSSALGINEEIARTL